MLIVTVNNEGDILEINEGFARLMGYSHDEAVGHSVRELNLWHDRVHLHKSLKLLEQDGNITNLEIAVRHKSGELISCLMSAELIDIEDSLHAVIIMRDISERKRMEEALVRERLLLRTVIDTLPDYIYLKDTEHRCLVSNAANARVLGATSPEEVEGKTLSDFYSSEEAAIYDNQDKLIIETGKPYLNQENHFVDLESGQQRWSWMSRLPFYDADGRILGIVGISRDITAFKEAEWERERLITELQIKNAELERFTYTVSHDLKTPLVTISGFLGFLERDVASGNMERIKQDTTTIRDAVEQMKRLLQDLLDLSRVGRVVNPPVDISFGVIAREALNMISIHLADLEVEVMVGADMPTVRVDYLRLVEVMQNLLENAIKFMGNQPQPHIEIGTRGQDKRGYMIFFVKDNGIGIDSQYHEQVFKLFHRLDQGIEGTGIGLALVKRIIETHGGRIWVESTAGKGATFCFTLPIKELT
jgi:PAS domain S-box-containing protein